MADTLSERLRVTEPRDLAGTVAPPDAGMADDVQDFGAQAGNTPEPEPGAHTSPRHHELKEDVKDILRQEAEFEMEQRAHDQAQLESQPDLGLDDTSDEARRHGTQERVARPHDLDAGPDEEEDSGARRDLLPDIEEISSTLDGDGIGRGNLPPDAALAPVRRSDFRRGFVLMLGLLGLLAALYVFAPQLGEVVPALKEPLDAYVALINKARVALDGLMQNATGKMQGAAEG